MLKQTVLSIFVASVFGLMAVAMPSQPVKSWRSDVGTLKPDERPVPFPFSSRLPFPWTMAQGVWFAQKGDFQSYYSFKVVKNRDSQEKQLVVKQIDATSCDVIARGTGIAIDRTLSAQMRSVVDGTVYSLGLVSFNDGDLPKQLNAKPIDGISMILSITVLDTGAQTHYLGIQKVTEKLNFNCEALPEVGDGN